MNAPRKNGKGKAGKSTPSLSEQTHEQILDIFKVAAENSKHPAIRDAALGLIKEKSDFQHRQEARLSPTVTALVAILMLILAGASSWFFFVHYSEHIAYTLSVIAIGLAIVAACLLAVFSGHLSQANFMSVVNMIWSKITGPFSRSREGTAQNLNAEEDATPSDSK